jgi:hypothetical protein
MHLWFTAFAIISLLLPVGSFGQGAAPASKRWYKGNTHAHTLRSDGDSTPEEVVKWYKDNGYNFIFITDHETITPVEEVNRSFGIAGQFAVFTGQEITDRTGGKPYHVNGLNISTAIMPNRDPAPVKNIQLNVDAVRGAGGVPQVNHPNFGWALNASEIAQLRNVNLVEIFNGHPLVNNLGGGGSPSVEEIWDSVLSTGKMIYGVASDDVHTVRKLGDAKQPTPGHGWVMVRADGLSSRAVAEALDRGDFYSSTGVELETYSADPDRIRIAVKKERWSKYRIHFIGKGGKVLAEFLDSPAAYKIRGDEGYVRVKVMESNGKAAWTQPVLVRR